MILMTSRLIRLDLLRPTLLQFTLISTALLSTLFVVPAAFATPAQDQAERVITAMNIKSHLMATVGPNTSAACIARQWPEQTKRINAVLVDSFSLAELDSLAQFFESPAGKKWNARSAAQTNNLNSNHPPMMVPDYAAGEEKTVDEFLASPLGQRFMQGEHAQHMRDEMIIIGMQLGKSCSVRQKDF